MNIPAGRDRLIILSGYAVVTAVILILLSTAFLRGGHPPGYGIINLVVILLAYPMSLYASIAGLKAKQDSIKVSVKRFYIMVGVSFLFALCASLLIVLKFILGKSI